MPSRISSPFSGTAVVIFESPMLEQLADAILGLGFEVASFSDVDDAMMYVLHSEGLIRVVVANGSLPGVLNGSDLATRLSLAYPTLPIVLADHFSGLVADNVMCLDKGWSIEDLTAEVTTMTTRLPAGKRSPSPEAQ